MFQTLFLFKFTPHYIRNGIVPDDMENYMRQGKKIYRANSWQISPCFNFKKHSSTPQAYKLGIATPTVILCNTSPERKSVPVNHEQELKRTAIRLLTDLKYS